MDIDERGRVRSFGCFEYFSTMKMHVVPFFFSFTLNIFERGNESGGKIWFYYDRSRRGIRMVPERETTLSSMIRRVYW